MAPPAPRCPRDDARQGGARPQDTRRPSARHGTAGPRGPVRSLRTEEIERRSRRSSAAWGWHAMNTDAARPDGGSDLELPAIMTTGRPLRDVTAAALGALVAANDPPELFVRLGAPVRVR